MRSLSDDVDLRLAGSRARLIARDQVGKLNARLTKQRMEDIDVNLYEWRTAGDERVRSTHSPLNRKICSWEDNTVYADSVEEAVNGEWKQRSDIGAFEGIPGEDIQCRCTGTPVFAELNQEIDEDLEAE